MLAGLLHFEWRYQTRRLAFASIASAFFGFGFVLAATGFGSSGSRLNSPYAITLSVGMATLLAVLAAPLFAAQAALRDTEHRMTELVFMTAVTKRHYLLGRLAGCVAALTAAFACLLPGLLVGTFLATHEPVQVGPFDARPYLTSFVLLALPSLLFIGALMYALALVTRSAAATYVGGVLLYMLYHGAALFVGSPLMASPSPPSARGLATAAWIDPFGLSAFFAATRYWSSAERDARLLDWSGPLLVNRVLWLGVSVLLIALIVRLFEFRLPNTAPRRARSESGPEQGKREGHHGVLRATSPAAGAGAALRAGVSLVWMEFRHALSGWPLPTLLVGWLAFVGIELVQTFRQREFGSAFIPTTALVLREIGQPLGVFGLLLVLFFAAELVWRERVADMAEIVDATPVGSAVLLAAKLVALGGLVVLFALMAALAGTLFQLVAGASAPVFRVYLVALAFAVVPLWLIAALAVLVQNLVSNRYVGIVASTLLVLFWHLAAFRGPEHPLLRFAALPDVTFTELAGFGPDRVAFALRALYWMAFTALLAALGVALWRRGTETTLWARSGWARLGRGRGWRRFAAVAGTLWLVLGVVLYAELERSGDNRSALEIEAWRAAYERAYRGIEGRLQPVPVAVEVTADLYPEMRRAQISGRIRMENRGAAPIAQLWVTARRDVAHLALTLDGRPADAIDARFATHRFELPKPLPPAGSVELAFAFTLDRRSFAAESERDLVENGSFLLSHMLFPSVGYRRSYELEDRAARARQGLPLVQRSTAFGDEEALSESATEGGTPVPFRFEALLTTTLDQVALAPGRLVESGARNGRRFFRYRTDAAISPIVALASARYAVTRRVSNGVAIEVYHHPGHGSNVEAMITAAAQALDHGRRELGAYPHGELRIVELASNAPLAGRGTGFAVPGMIFLLEHAGFLTERSDPTRVDVVSKRVAHEVAHQWFGHALRPVPGPGASMLVETLARDAELRVLAALHGEQAVPPVLAFELDRYFRGRAGLGREPETPLVLVESQGFVYYSKGAVVMNATRDLLGNGATNRAIGSLLASVRNGRQPAARELVAALEREAPEASRALLAEWWQRVVTYDIAVVSARATALPDGHLRVDLEIAAAKQETQGAAERALPLDEGIEVGFYRDDPGLAAGVATALQVERIRLRDHTRLTLDVDPAARYVLVDPRLLRLDRERGDNQRSLEITR